METSELDLSDFATLAEGRAHWQAQRTEIALELFERAVAESPRSIRALCEAARAFGMRFEVNKALDYLSRASELGGNDPRVAIVLARTYALIFRPEKAIETYEALRRRVGHLEAAALAELAELYEQVNQTDRALSAITESVARAHNQPEPQLIMARVQRRLKNDVAAERLLIGIVQRNDAGPTVLAHAWTELGQLRDSQCDFDGAIEAIENAKRILRQLPEATRLLQKALNHNEIFRQIYANIDRTTLNGWNALSLPPDPRCSGIAHLIGFPRTGTTLLEQVLGSHPGLVDSPERAVFGLTIFPGMCKPTGDEPLTATSLQTISRDRLLSQRRRYLDQMEAVLGEPLAGRVHLDKNPNYTSLLAGLIRLFPESRFLFALRDPRDVVISNYLRLYRLTEFSSCFLTWENTCLIYEFDMRIWLKMREIMDGNWLEVRYEDTIEDLERQARRALEFLGLPWDPVVLQYRDQSKHKVVNSPTHEAVRQPIYGHAVGRWRSYEKYLAPILSRLQPFVSTFGYE